MDRVTQGIVVRILHLVLGCICGLYSFLLIGDISNLKRKVMVKHLVSFVVGAVCVVPLEDDDTRDLISIFTSLVCITWVLLHLIYG